jgi:copper chaperone CopZ
MKKVKTLFLYIIIIPLILGLIVMLQRFVEPFFDSQVQTTEITLNSIVCNMCVTKVKKVLNSITGVIQSEVSFDQKKAFVLLNTSSTDVDKIENMITSAGYDANNKKADEEAYNNLPECCKKVEIENMPGNRDKTIEKSCSAGCCQN